MPVDHNAQDTAGTVPGDISLDTAETPVLPAGDPARSPGEGERDIEAFRAEHRRLVAESKAAQARYQELLAAIPGLGDDEETRKADALMYGAAWKFWTASDAASAYPRKHPELLPFYGATRRGWAVFPCRVLHKRPAVPDHSAGRCRREGNCAADHMGWEQLASSDAVKMASEWPGERFNYGVATGPSGLVVIDLDVLKPRQELPEEWRLPGIGDGLDVLRALAERAGEQVPATYTVMTPRGGFQLYFLAIPGREISINAGKIGPLIDHRGRGGYVIGAGSRLGERAYDYPVRLVRGGRYVVLDNRDPVPLPGWIADLAVAAPPARTRPVRERNRGARPAGTRAAVSHGKVRGAARAQMLGLLASVVGAEEGKRNALLHWAACRAGEMAAGGLVDEDTATVALAEAGRRAGLGENEIFSTIESGIRTGMAS